MSELVLRFNSRLKLLPVKFKSNCTGPYTIMRVYGNKAMEIEDAMGMKFKVNLLRLLVFFCEGHGVSVVEVVYFDDT